MKELGSVEFSEQEVAQRIRIEKNQVFARICLVTIMILYSLSTFPNHMSLVLEFLNEHALSIDFAMFILIQLVSIQKDSIEDWNAVNFSLSKEEKIVSIEKSDEEDSQSMLENNPQFELLREKYDNWVLRAYYEDKVLYYDTYGPCCKDNYRIVDQNGEFVHGIVINYSLLGSYMEKLKNAKYVFQFKTDNNEITRLRKHPNVVFSDKNWRDLTNNDQIIYGIPHPRTHILSRLSMKSKTSQEVTIHEQPAEN